MSEANHSYGDYLTGNMKTIHLTYILGCFIVRPFRQEKGDIMRFLRSSRFLLVLAVLAVLALACGGSTAPEVNAPSSSQSNSSQPTTAAAATTAPVGSARSNPAPAGSEIVIDGMAFVVTSATRPATDIIMAGNPFNTSPEAGQEYVLVSLRVTCQKTADEKCDFSAYSMKLLGSSGVQRDSQSIVAGVSGLFEAFGTEFFGGASIEGSIPFIVNSDETDLLLVYSPLFGNPFYLAIE